MKFPNPVSVKWIAELIQAEIVGDAFSKVYGINEIHKVETGDLCFVDHPKYYDTCINSAATHIIINTKDVKIREEKNPTRRQCESPPQPQKTSPRQWHGPVAVRAGERSNAKTLLARSRGLSLASDRG